MARSATPDGARHPGAAAASAADLSALLAPGAGLRLVAGGVLGAARLLSRRRVYLRAAAHAEPADLPRLAPRPRDGSGAVASDRLLRRQRGHGGARGRRCDDGPRGLLK